MCTNTNIQGPAEKCRSMLALCIKVDTNQNSPLEDGKRKRVTALLLAGVSTSRDATAHMEHNMAYPEG